jgi:hypothetical protein
MVFFRVLSKATRSSHAILSTDCNPIGGTEILLFIADSISEEAILSYSFFQSSISSLSKGSPMSQLIIGSPTFIPVVPIC